MTETNRVFARATGIQGKSAKQVALRVEPLPDGLPPNATDAEFAAWLQKPATDAVAEGTGGIATARAEALAAIGEDDSHGARGAALTAIGGDNSSGARGGAIAAIGEAGDDQVERITGLGALLTQVTYNPDGTITEIINGVTTTYTFNATGTISRTIGAPVNATITTTFTANGISEA